MQRRLVKDFAADVFAKIEVIKGSDPAFRRDLDIFDIYIIEDFVVAQLEFELKKIITQNKNGDENGPKDYLLGNEAISFNSLHFFVDYLKKFEGLINGVHAERERRVPLKKLSISGSGTNGKSANNTVDEFHAYETRQRRITDCDYPSSPDCLMSRVNAMLAIELHQNLVVNAPNNSNTGDYRLPIDFLYSGFPSQFPHMPEVGLMFNKIINTESGRPVVILVSLDELRSRLSEDPNASVLLRHTCYTEEEKKCFSDRCQPKLSEAERIKLCQHSTEAHAYYHEIISLNSEESVADRDARLDRARAVLVDKMNQPGFQPGYRVGFDTVLKDEMAIEAIKREKPSARRLLENGFMRAFDITNVDELAKMLEMVQLNFWQDFVESFDYMSLGELLLPKIKVSGNIYPDYDLLKLENVSKFGKFLEGGLCTTYVDGEQREVSFWNETSEMHDRAVQVLYATLLKYKREKEQDSNTLVKVATLEKYITFLCTCVNPSNDPKEQNFSPMYCMNQFGLFLQNDGTDKAYQAASENSRVGVLNASGVRRHDASVKQAKKPLSHSIDSVEHENLILPVPQVYSNDLIKAEIECFKTKCGRHCKESLLDNFSDVRVTRLKAHLTLISSQTKSSVTGFSIFDRAYDSFNDPFVNLFESLEFYDPKDQEQNDVTLSYFVMLYICIRAGESLEGREDKLAAAGLLLDMLALGDKANDICTYIAKLPNDKLNAKQKETMIACFTEGRFKNDRLTKLGLMAKKVRDPQTYIPKIPSTDKQPQKSGLSSWFGFK